jgi:hypothetical protein
MVTEFYTLTQADVDTGGVTIAALFPGKILMEIMLPIFLVPYQITTHLLLTLVQQENITVKDGIYVDSNNDGVTNIE